MLTRFQYVYIRHDYITKLFVNIIDNALFAQQSDIVFVLHGGRRIVKTI